MGSGSLFAFWACTFKSTLGKILIMETQGNTGMNYVTRDIMYRYDLTAEAALQVQDYMYNTELDFSECSEFEYDRCMNQCYNEWRSNSLRDFNPYISG